jgi:HlyD family secretion protein
MPTTETRRLNPVLMWVIFLAVIVVAALAAHFFSHDQVEIRAAAVNHQNLQSTESTNGKVEPIEEFPAYAPAPGVIARIYVEVGQKVKAGQLLIKMDDSAAAAHLAAARSTLQNAKSGLQDLNQGGTQEERNLLATDLARAQSQQQQAANDLAALKQLQQKGAASPSEISSAEARLQNANGLVKSLQIRSTDRYGASDRSRSEAQLADAKAAVAAAQSSYADDNIRSKVSGTVYSIPVSQYDYVPAGENLMDVADLNRIQVRAYFDEPTIGVLAVGQAVKISWDARPNQTWHGHISRAPTTIITYGTRNVGECIITVDDARGDLLPNTNVTVTVTTSQRFNVLSIPREALHTDGGDYVYRVVDGKLVRTPVQVGPGTNLTRAEITSGLTDKDTVATGSLSNRELSNGLAVKIVE